MYGTDYPKLNPSKYGCNSYSNSAKHEYTTWLCWNKNNDGAKHLWTDIGMHEKTIF